MSKDLDKRPSDAIEKQQLQLLFDYTKFHIGLYAGVIAGLLALAKLGGPMSPPVVLVLGFAVLCVVAAGASGGIVASNIPEHDLEKYYPEKEVGFFGWECTKRKAKDWCRTEHFFFWLAIVTGLPMILYHVLGA